MSEYQKIANLKSIQPIHDSVKKLFVSDNQLMNKEKQFLLSIAILLFMNYQKDNSYKTSFEFAYFIILKYSLLFKDWVPLYDLSVNLGLYPISEAINFNCNHIRGSILSEAISITAKDLFSYSGMIETKDQNFARNGVLDDINSCVSYIAPTSYGKSQLIIDHIIKNLRMYNRFVIVVPTKSLLLQTYRNIKNSFKNIKVLIHDEMYEENDRRFIAVFTQERALRLLEKNKDVVFDCIYVDEAHKLLENDYRSILLSRLIKLSKIRNNNVKLLYLSPLLKESSNILLPGQEIKEYRIPFNIKEPMIYEYENDGSVNIYNRFFNEFYVVKNNIQNYLQYVCDSAKQKNFIYLYSPIKIEKFAKLFFDFLPDVEFDEDITQIVHNLNKYVHEDFYISKYLKKGIVYIHGKIPDDIKDYIEYKFASVDTIKYLIANNVILEGINLPFEALFIMDAYALKKNSLINLIGRVNRLNTVLTRDINDLEKLLPSVHFVNSDREFFSYDMRSKIELLKVSDFKDELENPLLNNFDDTKLNIDERQKCEKIVEQENFVFEPINSELQKFKQNMIKQSMDIIYNISDDICSYILQKINSYKQNNGALSNLENVFDLLNDLFISGLENYIIDNEFVRLSRTETRKYYNRLIAKYRKRSLKEQISLTAKYLEILKKEGQNPFLWIGKNAYGECDRYGANSINRNYYVDIRTKSHSDIVNLSIVKIKMEQDFMSFKLNRFFQLMLDYGVITSDLYNELVYGTNDVLILSLAKLGLSLNIINKLKADNQLENLHVDEFGNLTYNEAFVAYKNNSDDFFKYELDKYLP